MENPPASVSRTNLASILRRFFPDQPSSAASYVPDPSTSSRPTPGPSTVDTALGDSVNHCRPPALTSPHALTVVAHQNGHRLGTSALPPLSPLPPVHQSTTATDTRLLEKPSTCGRGRGHWWIISCFCLGPVALLPAVLGFQVLVWSHSAFSIQHSPLAPSTCSGCIVNLEHS